MMISGLYEEEEEKVIAKVQLLTWSTFYLIGRRWS